MYCEDDEAAADCASSADGVEAVDAPIGSEPQNVPNIANEALCGRQRGF